VNASLIGHSLTLASGANQAENAGWL
jgi:hypothetical protein